MSKLTLSLMAWLMVFVSCAQPSEQAFVVLELFTSEGCSSCPKADQYLNEIIEQSQAQKRPVYGLAFHITYWDYLAWKDPYGNEKFTQRQRAYGKRMGLNNVYTPQLIVNGNHQFVGSNRTKANAYISEALEEPVSVRIDLDLLPKETESKGRLKYHINSDQAIPWESLILNLALVERDLHMDVKRGENSGRSLYHQNVVRYFNSHIVSPSDIISFKIPDEVDTNNSEVIVYLQEKKLGKILSAAAVSME